jgi:hypothetical protein
MAMHVLTLPPRHLLRVTLVAALLALALTALLAAPIGPAGSDRGAPPPAGSATPTATSAPPARTTAVRPPLAPTPEWLANPVAPPRLGAPAGP